MRLRSFSLRVAGAAALADDYPNPREVARRLGGIYATVRPDAQDLLVTVAIEAPEGSSEELSTPDELRRAAAELLAPEPHRRLVIREEANGPHAITAQVLEDKRRGTPALAGALQAPEDLRAWDDFLARVQPRGVIELGTGSGAFSRWLAARVEWFRTIDVGRPDKEPPGFIGLDLFRRADDVRGLIGRAPRPFVLYCDDGDKPLEVETFGPALGVGDFLAVHDYGTEIFEEDMPSEFAEEHTFGLTSFYRKTDVSAGDGGGHTAAVSSARDGRASDRS